MSGLFKSLIAVTCFVIIAGVGYFVAVDIANRPSSTERLLAEHERVMEDFDRVYGN